eukprot:3936-Heterococcus_DN1.PRE.5
MHSAANNVAVARWCKTVRRLSVFQTLVAKPRRTCSPVSMFSADDADTPSINNHTQSKITTESSRRARFLTEFGCSCSEAAHNKYGNPLSAPRRIALAALPLFKDAIDWPLSHLLQLPTKQVLWQIVADFPAAEQQHAEYERLICDFVERFITAGVPARQQRWSKLRACVLTMTASLKTLEALASSRAQDTHVASAACVFFTAETTATQEATGVAASRRAVLRGNAAMSFPAALIRTATVMSTLTDSSTVHVLCLGQAVTSSTVRHNGGVSS